jgi:hypothetical protein
MIDTVRRPYVIVDPIAGSGEGAVHGYFTGMVYNENGDLMALVSLALENKLVLHSYHPSRIRFL